MAQVISERQLILPSLYLMSISKSNSISTTDLITGLQTILNPSPEDLASNPSRGDSKFSQKVRNLKSHDTFEKYGELADYNDGVFTINKNGYKLLNENFDFLKSIIANDFSWEDIKTVLEAFSKSIKNKRPLTYIDEDTIIREGYKKQISASVFERSKKLRDAAFEFYLDSKGHISCEACRFDFKLFYGEIGTEFIELHHTKPVFMYQDEDVNKKINDAIKNITPVCSNCHRMIHRNWKKPLEIQNLIENINTLGTYQWSPK